MKKFLLEIIIMFFLLQTIVYSQNEYCTNPQNASSAFTVVLTSPNLVVNPGENLTLNIYFPGFGTSLFDTKLNIYTDGKFLVEGLKCNTWGSNPNITPTPFAVIDGIHVGEMFNTIESSIITIADTGITKDIVKAPADAKIIIPSEDIFHELCCSKISGDHEIYAVFTYYDGDKWYLEKSTLKFHVTTWIERNGWWITILGVIIAVISIVIAIFREDINKKIKSKFLTKNQNKQDSSSSTTSTP